MMLKSFGGSLGECINTKKMSKLEQEKEEIRKRDAKFEEKLAVKNAASEWGSLGSTFVKKMSRLEREKLESKEASQINEEQKKEVNTNPKNITMSTENEQSVTSVDMSSSWPLTDVVKRKSKLELEIEAARKL